MTVGFALLSLNPKEPIPSTSLDQKWEWNQQACQGL